MMTMTLLIQIVKKKVKELVGNLVKLNNDMMVGNYTRSLSQHQHLLEATVI